MGSKKSGWRPASPAQEKAGFGWFYDKPLPYSLTTEAKTVLDDPETGAEAEAS